MTIHRSPLVVTAMLLFVSLASLCQAAPPEQTAEIDKILHEWYAKKGIEPTPLSNDPTFVRRAYLRISGRIPTFAETRAFLESNDPDKRSQLIDDLLQSDGYVHSMVQFWEHDLKVKHPKLRDFIKTALFENWPYDKVVRSLVSAQSELPTNPAKAFYLLNPGNPFDHMANTVQAFLGTEINCAQCHDHPYSQWTQIDYYRTLAFSYGAYPRKFEKRLNKSFRAEERKRLGDKLIPPAKLHLFQGMRKAIKQGEMTGMDPMLADTDVRRFYTDEHNVRFYLNFVSLQLGADDGRGGLLEHNASLTLPENYQYSDLEAGSVIDTPKALFGEIGVDKNLTPGQKLEAFSEWMCSSDNERFALSIANRLWKRAMGRGLVEPVDDLGDNPEADIPELMNFLEALVVELNFDMKKFFRVIYNTQLFAQESLNTDPAMGAAYDFRAPVMERMNGYQVFDSFVALANPYPEPENFLRDQIVSYRKTLEFSQEGANVLKQTTFDQFYAGYRKWRSPRLPMEKERKVFLERFKELSVSGKSEEAAALKEAFLKKHGRWTFFDNLRYFNNDSRAPDHLRTLYGDAFVENWQARAKAAKPKAYHEYFIAQCVRNGMEDKEAAQSLGGVRATSYLWQRKLDMQYAHRDGGIFETFGGYFVRTATVPQALSLVNGRGREILSSAMRKVPASPVGSVANYEEFDDRIDALFLAVLSRYPTDEERMHVTSDLNSIKKRSKELAALAQGKAVKRPESKNKPNEGEFESLENLLFGLLNSLEFLHVH